MVPSCNREDWVPAKLERRPVMVVTPVVGQTMETASGFVLTIHGKKKCLTTCGSIIDDLKEQTVDCRLRCLYISMNSQYQSGPMRI